MGLSERELRAAGARVALLPPHLRGVLEALASGATYKEVAEARGLSEGTVRVYTERVYSTLGVHSAVQATRVWMLGREQAAMNTKRSNET